MYLLYTLRRLCGTHDSLHCNGPQSAGAASIMKHVVGANSLLCSSPSILGTFKANLVHNPLHPSGFERAAGGWWYMPYPT